MATVQATPRARIHEGPFVNEPLTDFTREENARKMRAAVEKVRGQLGREYDLIIGGRRVKTQDKIKSINPAKPSEMVGLFQKAGKDRSEEHTSELQSHSFISYAVFCLKKKK